MAETIIIKGALEDHLGRILHPDTEADQVIFPDGKTAAEKVAELLANLAKYLPLTGGTLTGDLKTNKGNIHINSWGCISAGTDGTVVIGENVYKHATNNTYHYATTHATMGARGIVFRNGVEGIWYFDTGRIATTANTAFNPTFVSLTDKATKNYTGNLNDITANMTIDCSGVTNAPGDGWYFVQHIAQSTDPSNNATQIAYALNSTDVKRRRKSGGTWSAWEPFLTASNTPTQYYSTVAPTASDGKDGDVWDVYV